MITRPEGERSRTTGKKIINKAFLVFWSPEFLYFWYLRSGLFGLLYCLICWFPDSSDDQLAWSSVFLTFRSCNLLILWCSGFNIFCCFWFFFLNFLVFWGFWLFDLLVSSRIFYGMLFLIFSLIVLWFSDFKVSWLSRRLVYWSVGLLICCFFVFAFWFSGALVFWSLGLLVLLIL